MKERSPPLTAAQRQAEYKARKLAQGFKRTTVWLHEADFEAGYQSWTPDCPPDRDLTSWVLGYCTARQEQGETGPEEDKPKRKKLWGLF